MKSTLAVLPTGAGKTIVFASVIHRWPEGRVMVLAHREELIVQAVNKLKWATGEKADIEMGERWADAGKEHRVVVSSVQTLNSRNQAMKGDRRMARFNPDDFGLVVTDEAHHATAASYRRVYNHFGKNPHCRHLGVTATPDRADEEALGQVYDSVAVEVTIKDLVDWGYLVPIKQQLVDVDHLDYSKVDLRGGDFVESQLAEVLHEEESVQSIAHPTMEIVGDRKTLVFAADIAQAEMLTDVFNRRRRGSAYCVHSGNLEFPGLKPDERRSLLEHFKYGRFQFLVNVGVLTEGFDEPSIECVAMGRPTLSRALYAQMIGRGTRTLPGVIDGLDTPEERRSAIANSGKGDLLVLDFVGNSGVHRLMSVGDVLDGKASDEVLDLAYENARKSGRAVDFAEEIEKAEEEIERRNLESRKKLIADARYRSKIVDPFEFFGHKPKREPGWHKGRKPSEKQKAALLKFGVPKKEVDRYSFHQASERLDALIHRIEENKCSFKQAKLIAQFGYDPDVSFEEASAIIDKLAKNNWRRPRGE